ncbi:hypothetical protein DL767_001690 [Monosporascus sp. MG133]|nr:hypothetical protein DL767_001690 [Monosporascus sp. MG133]
MLSVQNDSLSALGRLDKFEQGLKSPFSWLPWVPESWIAKTIYQGLERQYIGVLRSNERKILELTKEIEGVRMKLALRMPESQDAKDFQNGIQDMRQVVTQLFEALDETKADVRRLLTKALINPQFNRTPKIIGEATIQLRSLVRGMPTGIEAPRPVEG